MDASIEEIRRRIVEVAPGLHSAGTFPARTLDAIARAAQRQRIRHSAETGCGASTLLLSHLSEHHTVFALEDGHGSVTNVRRSPLLRQDAVTFIEGPSQITLPGHRFTGKLQLVLIDGPHAYPFPDLEYYFLYPHLDTGAVLILDDIHIPSVHNLFQFLRKDAMFQWEETVQTTAFFTRTDAPVFDPTGDGWALQKYNAKPLLRYAWKGRVLDYMRRHALPAPIERSLTRLLRSRGEQCALDIVTPQDSATVSGEGVVEGSVALPEGGHLWALVRRKDADGWWPQGNGAVPVEGKRWSVAVTYGGTQDGGWDFEIAALVVGQATHELWKDWVLRVKETGLFPPVQLPSAAFVQGEAFRRVTRAG